MESVPFALQSMSTHGFALAQSDGLAIFINSAALSASCAIALLAAAFGTAGYMRLMAKGYSSTIATLSGFVSVISGFAFPVVVWTLVLGDHPSPSGDVSECLTLLNGALCGLLFALIYWGRARQLPGNPSRTGGPRPRHHYYRRWAIVVLVALVALALAAGLMCWRLDGWSGVQDYIKVLPRFIGAGSLVPGLLLYYERRYHAQSSRDDLTTADAYVLYLRPFALDCRMTFRLTEYERDVPDGTRSWASYRRWVTLEQFLADEVERQVGRFVALGNPEDALPPGGALRVYIPDGDWRAEFRRLAVGARAILMQPGDSSSLSWELAMIRAEGIQPRLFVVSAPKRRSSIWSRSWWVLVFRLAGYRYPRWADFATRLREAGFDPGSQDPGLGSVVSFDAHGRRVDIAHGLNNPERIAQCVAGRLADVPEPQAGNAMDLTACIDKHPTRLEVRPAAADQ